MKQILLIVTMFVSTYLLGQPKDLQSIEIDTNFTWRNSTLAERDSFYFNLPMVRHSDFKTHYRISLTGHIIDFFSNDNENFQGILTNTITEYKLVKTEWGEDHEASRIVFQKLAIDSVLSSSIAKQILQTGQDSIPTDSLIPAWNHWYLHCGSIEFQFKLKGKHNEQSFHCPWSQSDTTKYADIIVFNYKLLKNKLELEKKYDEFKALLTKGKTYSRDDYRMMYIMTKKQSEAWNRDAPRRDYLKSIKDTIDSHLRTEIARQKVQLKGIDCFEDYRLTFNKNGRLGKLKVSDYNKPKLSDGLRFYLEDKREIRKCRKRIKQVFREINLSSFNLKCKVPRTLSFGLKGKVQLRDNMTY